MPALETEPMARPIVDVSRSEPAPESVETTLPILATKRLNAWFGQSRVIRNVSLEFLDRSVTAVIGPSGCGKSTMLRCLNRMHETVAGAIVEEDVTLGDASIYKGGLNAIAVRRHLPGRLGQRRLLQAGPSRRVGQEYPTRGRGSPSRRLDGELHAC